MPVPFTAVRVATLLTFAILMSSSADALINLPPWRGVRQVLEVGPWGKVVDKVSRKATKVGGKVVGKVSRKASQILLPSSQVLFVDSNDGSTCLLNPNQLPPKQGQRIIAVSDTHGKHRFLPPLEETNADVLVHCGDLLQRYGYAGDLGGGELVLRDFHHWLSSLDIPHKVFIGGNHDQLLEEWGEARVRDMFQKDDNIHYLQDSAVTFADGLTLYGSPWSPEGGTGNTAFQQGHSAAALVDKLQSDPCSIDVLMTHAACTSWEPLLESHNVKCWVHGHWHDAHGKARVHSSNGCVSVNVASNDMIYRPKNPPIVMDVCIQDRNQ